MSDRGRPAKFGRMTTALVACFAVVSPAIAARAPKTRSTKTAQAPKAEPTARIQQVRFWSNSGAIRIAVELSGPFEYRSDRLSNPDRLFFDLPNTKPTRNPRGVETIKVGDVLVRQIRVAETLPGTTRVVLDLNGSIEHTASRLSNPDRLIIELRPSQTAAAPLAPPPSLPKTETARTSPPPSGPIDSPAPPVPERTIVAAAVPPPPHPASVETVNTKSKTSMAEAAAAVENANPSITPRTPAAGPPVAAKRNSSGQRSLTRVLGLKLGRVVLDPGHGGHDVGTQGRGGLLEKELVLDVAKRLGVLIEERMGSEVVFTRDDDRYIPLEERTQTANRHKADLFLSIHANSSTIKSASGVETYYLNFTTDKSALEVAARENASSEQSIFDLGDLVRKIARKEKVEESREFASRIQSSLTSMPGRARARNRGVKKAPFVVLIGAAMPSVLAEIGFISNPQEEALMKKPEHRQKIAEALFKGLSQYASSLSRFEIAGGPRHTAGDNE